MPHPYDLNDVESALLTRTEALVQEVVARHAAAVDSDGRFPSESIEALRREKLLGLCVSKELGGLGQGPRAFAVVAEELARGCASTAMVFVMHVSAQQAVTASSTLASSKELQRAIAAGQHLTTLAFSEKGSRSQFWTPVSKLVEAPGGFTTTAYKSWSTSANHADSYVSSGQRAGAGSPLESTLYLVRRGAAGVHTTAAWDGLGLRGNDSAPVMFEAVKVATADLVSAPGEGAQAMLEVVLPWFCIGSAAMANGLCRATVAATASHLTDTHFEHTGSALRDLPNLRARLAEMAMRTEQARALLGRTLREMMQPSAEAPSFVLLARLSSLQAAVDVTDLAMKTCGGAAFSRHIGVERSFRDARAGWVMAPTVDHLNDFVGKALTGLPLF